jgi:hypothetical protein
MYLGTDRGHSKKTNFFLIRGLKTCKSVETPRWIFLSSQYYVYGKVRRLKTLINSIYLEWLTLSAVYALNQVSIYKASLRIVGAQT